MSAASRIHLIAAFLTLSITARAQLFEVAEASIADEQKAMSEGRVTSKALVQAYLTRIEAFDRKGPRLNAMISLNPRALEEAAALDRERAAKGPRGPLHGIPVIVKDNYGTKDMPTTAGSLALLGFIPSTDAYQVRKLREAGAVIVGKANLQELASGIVTVSSAGGQTLNPYDPTRNPGGSSGGTGAAIAASYAAAGMGSDTCGSIRIPSSHNNLVGLRPSKGLSSIAGIVPMSVTQDVGGPLARTVADLAAMLDATIGEDPADPATLVAQTRPRFADSLRSGSLKNARIGILEPLFGDGSDDQDVLRIVRAAATEMNKAGAVMVPVPMPELNGLLNGTSLIDLEFREDVGAYLAQHPNAPVQSLGEILDRGLYHASLETVFNRRNASKGRDSEEYRKALAKRVALTQAIVKLMDEQKLDALLYPTIRRKPARIGDNQGGSTCQLSAATGFPALSMPAGFTVEGLPVGVEILGRAFDDAKLVSLAYDYEQNTHHRRAPSRTPALGAAKSAPLVSWREKAASAGARRVTASFTFDPATAQLRYSLAASGFPAGELRAATLHRVSKNDTGPVVSLLANQPFSKLEGAETLSEADREKLLSGSMYLLLTSSAGPIRVALKPSVNSPKASPADR
jgi:Asp-tRNA(Asn)/Glu-tRNA(Gln) amidotransferase A subunit family amidase